MTPDFLRRWPALFGLLACAAAFAQPATGLSLPAQVGQRMFFDKQLSASGQLACASCHDPAHAYGPPNNLAVQPGGARMTRAGLRAVPSLRYKEDTPAYADLLDNPDGISTPGPGGGFTQDGRAPTLAAQARIPLLNPLEMANRRPSDVVRRLSRSGYAALFRQAFGDTVFTRPQQAFEHAMQALQAFQKEDPSFHPYDSKYDRYAGNKLGGTFTPAEARGFAVYSDPEKGNCFACHYNGAGLNGSVKLFTDFTYAAIGVPRNPAIPANRDRRYFDLGICARGDHPKGRNASFCGLFKTPTLRNVATREVFFHNGSIHSLEEAIHFYNTRDTEPERWYPTVNGVVQKYDDLPPKYRANIDTQKPLDGRPRGSVPAMTDQDMADLVAFLRTLTDQDQVPLLKPPKPSPGAMQDALNRMLDQRGDFCLGKYDWPIDLDDVDLRSQSRDALQLPVLERLGLAASRPAEATREDGERAATVPVRRFALTEFGQRFYRRRESSASDAFGEKLVHHADLCAGRLVLKSVVRVEPLVAPGEVVAVYTYAFNAAGPWAREPALLKVFPMLARIEQGDGTLQLKQRLRWDGSDWLPGGLAD